MRKFLIDIFLFSIPFFIYITVIVIVDPYNYLGYKFLIDESVKREISLKIEPHLYKLLDFENNPRSNVALGDSRTGVLFHGNKMENFADLSYGGASLNEIIQTFWYIKDFCKIDTLLIGISLNLYNKYNKRFWIEETVERKKNFFSYAFNKYTFKSTYEILVSIITKEEVKRGKPPFSKEEFWKYQLGPTIDKFYSQFSLPERYYQELKDITDYCNENNIRLIYWIPPDHIDMQNKIKEIGMENMDNKFRMELRSLGEVYDFNFPSELTKNKDNFTDPMHFTTSVANTICSEILNKQPSYAIYTNLSKKENKGI